MESLPGDELGDVLAALPPRSLAASRCVCKAWRATVDAGRHLRPHLFPLSVRGVFVETEFSEPPQFFQRPSSTGPKIAGAELDYDRGNRIVLRDCCNGLLLLEQCVVNPATRQWARLPPYPPSPEGMEGFWHLEYLVFEPTVSPHYQVVRLPYAPPQLKPKFAVGLEWPTVQVFSSGAQRWDVRVLSREGEEHACTFDDPYHRPYSDYAACWHQVLYLHCKNGFLVRITLLDDKYQVIEMPATHSDDPAYRELRIGKSKDGVYCALVYFHQLQVWFLREFGGKIDWVLMHDANLDALSWRAHRNFDYKVCGPWILKPGYCSGSNKEKQKEEEKLEWDSDNDNVLNIEDMDREHCNGTITVMGFHPYKEVVFLHVDLSSAIAYHWNSSKIQFMGKLYIPAYDLTAESYYIYTPC